VSTLLLLDGLAIKIGIHKREENMTAHEFLTRIGSDGIPVIPGPLKHMPAGSSVRVIVLTNEQNLPVRIRNRLIWKS
jgi:hypothetical protein